MLFSFNGRSHLTSCDSYSSCYWFDVLNIWRRLPMHFLQFANTFEEVNIILSCLLANAATE